jgi:hypothetical protein
MITIDQEAQTRIMYPFEIDRMSERCRTDNNYYTFPTPGISLVWENYFFLLANAEVKSLDPKYYYRPSYLSYYEYGVPNLDYLLMIVNNITCIEDFSMSNVIIPSMESIVDMCNKKYDIPDNPLEMEPIEW